MLVGKSLHRDKIAARVSLAAPEFRRPSRHDGLVTKHESGELVDGLLDHGLDIVVKTMHENWDKFRHTYKATMNVPPKMLAPAINPIPYHPGAIKYYQEIDIWPKEEAAADGNTKSDG